ncbi:hypothetical protein BDV96DRAFT_659646 [Lophiotrema nucula]|uniref:DUF7580 domain-containing protein n=1 Tax=Lophiotrema nucula TaxID=690887 RepID=A0A6A5Z9G7_9PLEO|nr:hypothetical protein BDV96DRAFT_659646 [Lophiotrema nucula]
MVLTGLELALAVVPLIIAAAEHHRTVARKSKAVASSKANNEQLLQFYFELYDELSLLRSTLNRVEGTSTHSEVIQAYHPSGEASRAEHIRQALGTNAQAFESILNRILKSINNIHRLSSRLPEKDLNDPMFSKIEAFQVAIDKGETHRSLFGRIRFTMNEKSRTVALHQIQKGNKKLERLLGASAEEYDRSAHSRRKGAPVARTRQFSGALYHEMARKWPRSCCHIQHEAKLCLWTCCSTEHNDGCGDILEMVVAVPDRQRRRASWQESTIIDSGSDLRTRRTVRFDAGESSPPLSPGRDIGSESLCTLLQQAQANRANLNIVYENGKLWQRRSSSGSLRLRSPKDVSLQDLLRSEGRTWSLRDKWILAVVLAHAVLHCSDSPWLAPNWSKEHVSFFKNDSTGEAMLGRPFLKVDFGSHSAGESEDAGLFMAHSNPALLSLGVMLLEVYLGKSIESQYLPEDLFDGNPNENTNLTTALRLLENADGDLVVGFRKAIKSCLDWDVHGPEDTGDLRKRLYTAIVEPLEDALEHGFDLKPETLGN